MKTQLKKYYNKQTINKMNRPIKFRFWGDFGDFNEEADTCEKEMLYGDRFHFFDHAPINDLFADKRFVVMQFTGLVDKNGKEIYEGDILKTHSGIGYMIFDSCGYAIKSYGSEAVDYEFSSFYLESEIIGNIFENPEILK